jgi:signal transduction histidine kinase
VNIAAKLFCACCAVLVVVLGLGLWSLQATRRLHAQNHHLVTEAIPAIRAELMLVHLVPTLMRHEARAIVLRDPGYERLHEGASLEFRQHMARLEILLRDTGLRARQADVQRRFDEYAALVQQQLAAAREGDRPRALRLVEGPGRETANALRVALDALLAQSLAALDQEAEAAAQLEGAARSATAASVGLSVALGLGVALFAARRIARPVRVLCRATEAIAEGQFDVPLAIRGSDEIGQLARAFLAMAARLRELERLRDDFFASVVHEFRSPLTSVGMAASLLATSTGGEKERRWVEIIELESRRLLRLTNELLEVSKLRTGAVRLQLAPADLAEMTAGVRAKLQPLLESKGVDVALDFPAGLSVVVCDRWRMEQVAINLLANAIRFTPAGGHIVVRGRVDVEGFVLSVEDTGIGIPAQELPHIFDRFRQVGPAREGSGLGLAIVKAIVEAHGGRVWAESREAMGTRVYCLLPKTPALDA